MLQRNLSQKFYQITYSQEPLAQGNTSISQYELLLRECKKYIAEIGKLLRSFSNVNKETDKEKQLLESEVQCWKLLKEYLKNLISKEKQKERPYYEYRRNFFDQFLFHYKKNKNYDYLKPSLKDIHNLKAYIPSSQYQLVSDIITYDETLSTINFIVTWLNKTYHFDEDTTVTPINFTKTLSKLNSNGSFTASQSIVTLKKEDINKLDPDYIFANGSELHDTDRFEHSRLMRKIFDFIRSGQIYKANEELINCNQMWRSGSLNGGLPFHDFLISDAFLLREEYKLYHDKFREHVVDDIKYSKNILEVMKTSEWRSNFEIRAKEYLHNASETDGVGYNETMGNANWILWLTTCRNMSNSDGIDVREMFEVLVYAALSYNDDLIQSHFDRDKTSNTYWHDTLWVQFRTYVFHEVMRRYLILYKLFNQEMPQTEATEQDYFDFENEKPESILKKVIGKQDYGEDDLYNIFSTQNQSNPLSGENYNGIQLKTLECIVVLAFENKSIWNSLIKQLSQLSKTHFNNYSQANSANPSQDQSFIGHRLRFYAYFTLMLERMRVWNNENMLEGPSLKYKNIWREDIDTIWDNYLKHMNRTSENENLIHLFLNIKDETKREKSVAEFLSKIENQEMRWKYKEEIDKHMPDIRQNIFKEIININERNAMKNSLETEKKRIESLKWLYLHEDQINDALKCSLKLIRAFLLESNLDAAMKLTSDLVSSIFSKVSSKKIEGEDSDTVRTYFSENESYGRLFDACRAYHKYQAVASNVPVSDASSVGDSMIIEQSQGPLNVSKAHVEERVKDAIYKIKKSLFSEQENPNHVIFNFDFITKNDVLGNLERLKELEHITSIWAPKLLNWLLEIFENNDLYNKWDELLITIGNPSSQVFNYLNNIEKRELLQKLALLMIKHKKHVVSILNTQKLAKP